MSSNTGEAIVASKMRQESTDLVVVNGNEYALVDISPRRKRAHICCGCDTRNFVFVVDSIGIAFYTLMMVSFALIAGDTLQYDDDHVQQVMDTLDHAKIGLAIAASLGGLFCCLISIYGAVQFNMYAAGIGGMWFAFEAIRGLILFNPGVAAIALCFCYPHAVFYYEVKNGVMSRETYEKEKICCDCLCNC